MLNKIAAIIRDSSTDNFIREISPDDINYLCISGAVEGGTVTFLAFLHNKNRPIFAIKVYRDSCDQRAHFEETILRLLSNNPANLSLGIPKLLFCGKIDSQFVLVQSIVSGKALELYLDKNGNPDIPAMQNHLDITTSWLCDLYTASRQNKFATNQPNPMRTVRDTLQAFFQLYSINSVSDQFSSYVKMHEAALSEVSGVCIQHTDFCRHNILYSGEGHKISHINVRFYLFAFRPAAQQRWKTRCAGRSARFGTDPHDFKRQGGAPLRR